MPGKSKAQVKKMHVLADQGKVSQATAAEFDVSGAAYKKLPEHVKKKAKK